MNTLGIVTVATHGTPVRLSTTTKKCNYIVIQPIKALGASGTAPTPNSGWVYLMRGDNAKITAGTNCVLALDVSQNAQSIKAPTSLGFDLSDYYLDSDTDGDGALISYA